MSDGPHRSLPMRRGWKRVAENADNKAFSAAEVREAIVPALEEDCREISPEFLRGLRRVSIEEAGSLFKSDTTPSLEGLRSLASIGLARVVLDYAIKHASNGQAAKDIAQNAMTDALVDHAARGMWQVEEHYCRKSTAPRANQVRERIEEAIGGADIGGLAKRILKPDSNGDAPQAPKRDGLDDGVEL
jgi:hypothetical protein